MLGVTITPVLTCVMEYSYWTDIGLAIQSTPAARLSHSDTSLE